eukprot:TRINITY_DN51172_c0_g1_i1.p1 TRINITY_DN51172_c0_g1~~TRINITY_DN51172_c0_g1_i1.p1  ORF type:complete len:281 (-),score=44.15 TRINITY_DN51172_c0_g1_i1:158-1000(-)
MAIDYSRFDKLDDSSCSDGEDDRVQSPGCSSGSASLRGTPEGLLQIFASIHDQRLEADRLAGTNDWHSAAKLYDAVSDRLLALEGVDDEAKLEAIGHRLEAFHARLGASRTYARLDKWGISEDRASAAIVTMYLDAAANARVKSLGLQANLVEDGRITNTDSSDSSQAEAVHRDGAEAYLLRGQARFELRNFHGAEADGHEAFALAKRGNSKTSIAACEALLLDVHMHLNNVPNDAEDCPEVATTNVQHPRLRCSSLGRVVCAENVVDERVVEFKLDDLD